MLTISSVVGVHIQQRTTSTGRLTLACVSHPLPVSRSLSPSTEPGVDMPASAIRRLLQDLGRVPATLVSPRD